jgi:transposase
MEQDMNEGESYWESHVAAVKREAIPVSVYAKRHGLSVSQLYYWRGKLATASAARADANNVAKFIALRLGDSAATPSGGGYILIVGSGVRLEMPTLPAPEWLAALGRAAGAR